jgi:hypothetical protein
MSDSDDDLQPIDVAPPPASWPPPPQAPWPPTDPASVEPPSNGRHTGALIAGLVALMIISGLVAFGVTSTALGGSSFDRAINGTPRTTPNPSGSQDGSLPSNDPDVDALAKVIVRQQDVKSGNTVQLIDNGERIGTATTLDLCNGTFASEKLRTARRQVVELNSRERGVLSTEAVLYGKPADAEQAFKELRRVHDACPHSPVVSPVGEPTVTTTFRGAPDASWGKVPGVERLAYDFTSLDSSGSSARSVAVYLHNGRALMGVYFPNPAGKQSPVVGKTSIGDIVRLFEERLAALPASVTEK